MPPLLRRIFWFLNKFFMIPFFRLGLGVFMGNPFTGYIMVMKVVGRKTGKMRFAPVNYAIYQGDIFCVSGGRKSSDWYKNLQANPQLELMLPAGAVFAHFDEVTDPELRRVMIRQVLQNAGFAGFFEGYNPFTISDADLMAKTQDLPLLRFHPLGLANSASDPGGWMWISVFALMALFLWATVR